MPKQNLFWAVNQESVPVTFDCVHTCALHRTCGFNPITMPLYGTMHQAATRCQPPPPPTTTTMHNAPCHPHIHVQCAMPSLPPPPTHPCACTIPPSHPNAPCPPLHHAPRPPRYSSITCIHDMCHVSCATGAPAHWQCTQHSNTAHHPVPRCKRSPHSTRGTADDRISIRPNKGLRCCWQASHRHATAAAASRGPAAGHSNHGSSCCRHAQ